MFRIAVSLTPAIAVAAVGLSLAAPARADQASAQACAQKLPPEAATIYQATAPQITPASDIIALLKPTVRSLVMDGKVTQATARASAKLAYPCLKDLK
jgi:hypothetical protein